MPMQVVDVAVDVDVDVGCGDAGGDDEDDSDDDGHSVCGKDVGKASRPREARPKNLACIYIHIVFIGPQHETPNSKELLSLGPP